MSKFSEEGSCYKNRSKVSCNSSSIKPQEIRYCEDIVIKLLEVPY
jgi:hypothetical protein